MPGICVLGYQHGVVNIHHCGFRSASGWLRTPAFGAINGDIDVQPVLWLLAGLLLPKVKSCPADDPEEENINTVD